MGWYMMIAASISKSLFDPFEIKDKHKDNYLQVNLFTSMDTHYDSSIYIQDYLGLKTS